MSKKINMNPIMSRKLKNGDWIIVSPLSEMLIVEEDIYILLKTRSLEYGYFEKSFEDNLDSLGFTAKKKSVFNNLLEESASWLFQVIRISFLIIGLLSFCSLIFSLSDSRIFFYEAITLIVEKPIKSVVLLIAFSSMTTFFHEMTHLFFSESLDLKKIKLEFKHAVAKVPMTHVWTWSKLGRITAICSGMVLDLLELFLLVILSGQWHSRWLSLMISIMVMKILWQFRIKKTTDIKILVMMLLDDPLLFQDKNSWGPKLAIFTDSFTVCLMVGIWISPIIQVLTN